MTTDTNTDTHTNTTAHHDGLAARRDAHVLETYGRSPLAFVRGKGTALFDGEGRPYLDFLCGLAVTSLGHAHPEVAAAITAQANTLVHTSNLYLTEPMISLAEKLAAAAGWDDGKVFFCNSGAEANEALIKLARRHGKQQHPDKIRVVALGGSFHGRTLATLEATGQPAKHAPFAPLAGFVDHVPVDDIEALRAAVGPDTCAVLLEVVQGEGGVQPLDHEFLLAARDACDEHGALLLVDEVQTGIGRTGTWFAFQQTPVVPDAISVAKALANGIPIGAIVTHGVANEAFALGDHASTFGGNPVAAAAACAVLDVITRDGLLDATVQRSARLVAGLDALTGVVPLAAGTRGSGLLLALRLDAPVAAAVEVACRERFLLVNAVAPDAIRLAPPLNVSEQEIDLAVSVIAAALHAVAEQETN